MKTLSSLFIPGEGAAADSGAEARAPDIHPVPRPRVVDDPDAPSAPAAEQDEDAGSADTGGRRGLARLLHPLVLVVLLPTLLVAAFEYLVAADQYESEAHFIVRGPQPASPITGLGQMLGIGGGATAADSRSVSDYLTSHDAVDALGRARLTAMFRRPEADHVTRLWAAAPLPETLLKYYRGKVHLTTDTESSLTTLSVRAFRAADAKALADSLLLLGEARVNSFNRRMLESGLAAARGQVREAEEEVETAQAAMTGLRRSRGDVDPERTATAQIQLAAQLQAQAAAARASFDVIAAKLSPAAPQYAVAARRARALDAQVATIQAGLTGSGRSVAVGLGAYERLKLNQEFSAKRYEAAAAALQAAREQLLKQQLFIVPVVRPNMPGKALYPKRLSITATAFFALLLAYAIGWLILAGVREHAE